MSGETGKTAIIIGASIAGGYIGGALVGSAAASYKLAVGLGWMAGGMLGQMLFPQKSSSHNMPQMAEYPVQGSSRGLPVPLIYGTRKVAGNIVWIGDLQSYIIVHKQSGGKGGGGGGGGSTTETRYRRSFLIAICEGPASVTRIWEGKNEISLEAASFFVGFNNTGISTIVGEDYGEYKDVLCAYFDSHELGNSQQLPNFTFEVQAGSIDFFTGSDIVVKHSIAKCRPDSSLDDTFATDGVYKIESSPASGTLVICESGIDGSIYLAHGHPDITDGWYAAFMTQAGGVAIGDTVIGGIGGGSFLVEDIYYIPATTDGFVHLRHLSGPLGVANEVYNDGAGNAFKIPNFANSAWKYIAKLTADGILDKSWGENGYKWIKCSTIGWLLEDKNGNLYGGISTGASQVSIFSLNSDGKIRWIHRYNPATQTYPVQSYTAVLSEDHKYIYIGTEMTFLGGVSSPTTDYNVIKLKTSNGAYDTTWSTNGRFMQGSHYALSGPNTYDIVRIPATEEIIFHHDGSLINGLRASITKLTVTGFRDTSWGEFNGMTGNFRSPVHSTWTRHSSMICDETGRLFTASFYISPTGIENDGTCYVTTYDKNGDIIYSFTIISAIPPRAVNCIFVWGGFIYLGSAKRTEDGITSPLHRYTFDGVHDTTWPEATSEYRGVGDVSFGISVIDRNFISCNKDANPAWTIYDVLTNTRYGAGIPATEVNIASFQDVAGFCSRNQYFFSFLLNRTRPVKDWIDHINSHFFGFLTQTEGLYSLGVFRNEDPVATLTQDNFLIEETTEDEEPEPPINISKRDPKDTANRIEVGWTNRDKLYNVNFAVANDHVEQRITGQTRKRVLGLDGITKETLATRLAWRYLYDSLYRFSDYTFRIGYQDRFIAPGQVVTLNDGDIVVDKKVRIVSIEEDKNGQNLKIEAREDEAYLYPDIEYQSATSKHSEAAAAALASPLLTFREDVASRLVYVSIVPQSADADGWYVYRSFDDVTYELAGTTGIDSVASANAHGTTDTTLPSHVAVVWKYDETIRVTLDANLAIDSGTELEFFNNKKLAKIGNEIIAYKTATPISGTTYELRELIRGLFNTEPVAHGIGEEFYTLDVDFNYTYTKEDIGRTIYFKMLTFTGDTIQQLADVTGVAYTIQGEYQKPAPVSLIRNVGREGFEDISGFPSDVDFNFGNRLSGWNFGGWGAMPWGQFEKDLAIKQVGVRLLKTDGTEILSELHDLFGYYADEYRITLEDADRDGNDPIDIEITAIGNLLSAARTSRIDIA